MPNLKPWELIILVLIVVILFGSKKLPDAARGIGRSLRIFKAETKGLVDDGKAEANAAPTEAAAPSPAITSTSSEAVAPPAPATPPAPAAAEPQPETKPSNQ